MEAIPLVRARYAIAFSVTLHEHGDFGMQVVYAPTLQRAICTFCADASAEYYEADSRLIR